MNRVLILASLIWIVLPFSVHFSNIHPVRTFGPLSDGDGYLIYYLVVDMDILCRSLDCDDK